MVLRWLNKGVQSIWIDWNGRQRCGLFLLFYSCLKPQDFGIVHHLVYQISSDYVSGTKFGPVLFT